MLNGIYGPTQNYAKDKYEILCHLQEVCGLTGKYLIKRSDYTGALRFLPKIFAWTCALLSEIESPGFDLEDMVLRKFPGVCPYCQTDRCICWSSEKPNLNAESLDKIYRKKVLTRNRSVDDFETLFQGIYGHTWRGKNEEYDPVVYCYARLTEELSEAAEAVRFYHLYPQNFVNEIADVLSWWFALSISVREKLSGPEISTSNLIWRSYPGHCRDCDSLPCFCQPAPVRELMSKPSPGDLGTIDHMTSLRTWPIFQRDIAEVVRGNLSATFPSACVRIDVDNFKSVNDTHGHDAGDHALKHIAAVLRSKARPRDRIYRVGGDEFAWFMPDTTEEEAAGVLRRAGKTLSERPVQWTNLSGRAAMIPLSISSGVAESRSSNDFALAFERADEAAKESKNQGRARVTRASSLAAERTLFDHEETQPTS